MSGRDTPLERMPVVILAGGLGTRLREETERVPKPLVGIGERPIVWHIMKLFGHHGAKRFILCLGFKSWLIKEFFLRYREHVCDFKLELNGEHTPRFLNNGADENWEITFAETGLHTATGGRLWRVQDYIDSETFMFTYGDGIGPVDIGALLDYHYDHSPRDAQRRAFAAQLALARELSKPVVVHSRDADVDMTSMLHEAGQAGVRGVLHCFAGPASVASAALEYDWFVSFSGIITFKKWDDLGLLRLVPDDRLLVESDAPYLAPVPFRGKRNEPSFVLHTAEVIARERGISAEHLAAETTANFERLFGLHELH